MSMSTNSLISLLYSFPLYKYATIYLFILLLMDIQISFSLGLFQIVSIQMFFYLSLGTNIYVHLLSIYLRVVLLKVMRMFMFRFDKYCQIISRVGQLILLPVMDESSSCSNPRQDIFILAILVGMYLTMVSICISLMISEVEHHFICLLVIWKSSFGKCCLSHFSIELTILLTDL